MKCRCGHDRSEHLRYGSRTLDVANAYRECLICNCREFRKEVIKK